MDAFLSRALAASRSSSIFEEAFAAYLDGGDAFKEMRSHFNIPKRRAVTPVGIKISEEEAEEESVYLCGHSLGLMPKMVRQLVNEELEVWAQRGVVGHFEHPHDRPWKDIGEVPIITMAAIVGARQAEIACMGTLTANIHMLLASFYKPTKTRYKILFEDHAFPSDTYAFTSQAQLHQLDPEETLVKIAPRENEFTLRTQDILDAIKQHGESIALVMFSGVQYYTGQFFDIEAITKAGHAQGCIVGWDLAHAVGNVPLQLHDWHVDFAVWCTYKYLNSGPGSIGGVFVHLDHAEPTSRPRLAGWWGHNPKTRFDMPPVFDPSQGAAGYQVSNPSVLNMVSLHASLQIFQAGMAGDGLGPLRSKSERLTAYLQRLLMSCEQFVKVEEAAQYEGPPAFTIITPTNPSQRGAQLSLLFIPRTLENTMKNVFASLLSQGIVADERRPDVIRLAPIPLYNSFEDVRRAAAAIFSAMKTEVRRFNENSTTTQQPTSSGLNGLQTS